MLNPLNKKVIELSEITNLTVIEISGLIEWTSRPDDYWYLCYALIVRFIDDGYILQGLESIKIENIQDIIDCIAWHKDKENINNVLNP